MALPPQVCGGVAIASRSEHDVVVSKMSVRCDAFDGLAEELTKAVPMLPGRPPLRAGTPWTCLGEWVCQKKAIESMADRKEMSGRISKRRIWICRDLAMRANRTLPKRMKPHVQLTDDDGSELVAPVDTFRVVSRIARNSRSGDGGVFAWYLLQILRNERLDRERLVGPKVANAIPLTETCARKVQNDGPMRYEPASTRLGECRFQRHDNANCSATPGSDLVSSSESKFKLCGHCCSMAGMIGLLVPHTALSLARRSCSTPMSIAVTSAPS